MIPPAGAREVATAALARLDRPDTTDLPARIASGAVLADSDLTRIRAFWETVEPQPDVPAWRLAAALLGGEPMRRTVAAANPPGQDNAKTGAMIAAAVPPDLATALAIDDGLSPDDLHITLAYLGDAADLTDPDRATVAAVLDRVPFDPPAVTLGHISHLGGPDVREAGFLAVVYEITSPGLHAYRADLVAELSAAGLEWSNRFAFRPHMTLTYIPEAEAETDWPEGPVDEPVTFNVPAIEFHAAGDIPTAVTAAAGPREFSRVAEVLSTVSADLAQIDRDTASEVRTAVELGWKSALDRVGRMVTRTSSADRSTPAIEVAVTANADQVAAVNPAKLIEPAVADTARHVRGVLERARTQTETVIAEAFFVDLDNVWTNPVGPVAAFLGSRMTADLLTRLSAAPAADRVDPTNDIDPYLAPYQITRDVLAAAGGASLLGDRVGRDDIGRPVSADGTPGNDTIGSGPDAQRAIDDSIAAHARTGITAAATQRGFIPAELSEELAEVAELLAAAEADTEPLKRVATYTWRINWNGTAEENLPAHKIMDGTIAASPSDILRMADAAADINEWPYVGARHPGDHPYCHCGWEVSYELVPRQLAL